jgi:ribonuclease R
MPRNLPSRNQILDVLASDPRPFHAREVATTLSIDEGSYPGFLRLLDDLVYQGVLTARPGQKFMLSGGTATVRGEEREGIISIAPRGFGFVSSAGATGDDVYIARESLGGAMHGDTVKINVRARGSRGPEGEVMAVLSRHIKRVAGTLRRRGKSAWLDPDDTRVRGPIVLEDAVDTRGSEGNSGKDGDAAVVSIARYPELFDENPVGRMEAVLGKPGEIGVEVAKVLVREQVEEVHSPEAFAEAEAYGLEVPEEMLEGREDLTHVPLPTIDPEDARDHDDAVWVERDGDGYRAWIAIADVSSYVKPDTHIDRESFKRGCSIYLPDRAIPMLPRPLSSNLCSLLPDVIRLCLAVEIEIDGAGHAKRSRLIRGFMKSAAKLTYGGVARALGLSDAPPREPKADDMVDGLRVAYELSRKLRTRRLKRGAVDFDLPEAKISLGDDGQPVDIQRRSQDAGVKRAYQLIEELMLLANETVAKWFADRKIPAVYRVHAAPDATKLLRFSHMCEELGIEFDPEIAENPKELSKFVTSFADHPKANVLNMLLLRSMKQATYDVVNIGHFGLASKAYLHFTSPIRRYPDLVVHRQVHAVVANRKTQTETELGEAALTSSVAERRVMDIEREVSDLYRSVFMRDKIGERYSGTVTALVGSGVYVALDSPFVDVLVRFEDLGGGGNWTLDDEGLRAFAERTGEIVQLGQRLVVDIIDVSLVRRAVYAKKVGSLDEPDLHRQKGGRKEKKHGKETKGHHPQRGRGGKPADARKGKPDGKKAGADTSRNKKKGKGKRKR